MIAWLRRSPASTHLGLMLALTFSTGIVDAVGYLGLDRVFTGNMTGNVVILAMAIAGGDDLPILGPILALLAFMVGAAVAGRALRGRTSAWSARTTGVLVMVAVVLAILSVAMLTVSDPPHWLLLVVTAALGFAMGGQAGGAWHVGVKDVTTVVVTSTLAGLAADSIFGAGVDGHPWRRRAGAVVLLGLGAAAGALTLRVHLGVGTAVSAVITVVVAVLGHLTIEGREPVDEKS